MQNLCIDYIFNSFSAVSDICWCHKSKTDPGCMANPSSHASRFATYAILRPIRQFFKLERNMWYMRLWLPFTSSLKLCPQEYSLLAIFVHKRFRPSFPSCFFCYFARNCQFPIYFNTTNYIYFAPSRRND